MFVNTINDVDIDEKNNTITRAIVIICGYTKIPSSYRENKGQYKGSK